MDKIILTTDNKIPKTFTISPTHIEWMEKNVPENKRSKFVDAVIGRYIKRHEAAKTQRQQSAQVTA